MVDDSSSETNYAVEDSYSLQPEIGDRWCSEWLWRTSQQLSSKTDVFRFYYQWQTSPRFNLPFATVVLCNMKEEHLECQSDVKLLT